MSKDDTQHASVPRLRFPEFREEPAWEEKPLHVIADPITERVGDSECTPYTVTTGVGLVSQEDRFGRTIAGKSLKNYYRLHDSDFAYNKSATKLFPQGYIARYQGNDKAAVPNSIFTCFRIVDEEVDPAYLDYLFQGNLHGRWLRKYITVGARAHGALNVSDDGLFSLPVPLPSGERSLDEQQKITYCLGSLDELITAEGRKLEMLRDHKKWLLQQLFPREGETRPRLRFPEFQDAPQWEETSLGQVVDFQSGGTPSKSNLAYWNGAIPWVSAKDMKQLFLDDTEAHITTAAADDGAKQVPAGTVLMLTRGMTLLKDVPICVLRRRMSFNQDVRALHAKGDLYGGFLPYLLLGNKQQFLSMVDTAGHGTGRLDTEKLKTLNVMLPTTDEQRRIAAFLSSLEDLIPPQSEKLNALRTHKRGLMQQLFPSPKDATA